VVAPAVAGILAIAAADATLGPTGILGGCAAVLVGAVMRVDRVLGTQHAIRTVTIVACWMAVGLTWLIGAIHTVSLGPQRSTRKAPRGLTLAAAILGAFQLATLSVMPAHLRLGAPWPEIGLVILLSSTALTLSARLALGTMWSWSVEIKDGHALRTTGPYALTRHPIYTGFLGMLAGSLLLAGTGRWVLLLPATLLILAIKIHAEENLLRAQFPDQYPAYRDRVPQLIPRLPRPGDPNTRPTRASTASQPRGAYTAHRHRLPALDGRHHGGTAQSDRVRATNAVPIDASSSHESAIRATTTKGAAPCRTPGCEPGSRTAGQPAASVATSRTGTDADPVRPTLIQSLEEIVAMLRRRRGAQRRCRSDSVAGTPRVLRGDRSLGVPRRALAVLAVSVLAVLSGGGRAAAVGLRWRSVPAPRPPGARQAELSAVACSSARACVAVGDWTGVSGRIRALIERWDGGRWRTMPARGPSGGPPTGLGSVSCPTRRFCIAVGRATPRPDSTEPLSELWNGSRWSLRRVGLPLGVTSGDLSSVSCSTPRSCMAVGGSAAGAWAVRWNGRRWRGQMVLPAPAGSFGSTLTGVSCVTARSCTAAGNQTRVANSTATSPACFSTTRTLAERWNGSHWSIQPSPNADVLGCDVLNDSELVAVSCAAQRMCVSVGDSTLGACESACAVAQVTLAESWTGMSWSIRATVDPDTSHTDNYLVGVSCPNRAWCTAVGNTVGANGNMAGLAEQWNGARWSAQPTPGLSAGDEYELDGVACPSKRFCVSVGYFDRLFTGLHRPAIVQYGHS
jgi:protein-S-isoprenylcysteine O-methyltransferase Ste14